MGKRSLCLHCQSSLPEEVLTLSTHTALRLIIVPHGRAADLISPLFIFCSSWTYQPGASRKVHSSRGSIAGSGGLPVPGSAIQTFIAHGFAHPFIFIRVAQRPQLRLSTLRTRNAYCLLEGECHHITLHKGYYIFMKNVKVISLKQFSCCIKGLGVSKSLEDNNTFIYLGCIYLIKSISKYFGFAITGINYIYTVILNCNNISQYCFIVFLIK